MNNLWDKSNYKSKIEFLIDTPVIEYDISKANINVLRDANAISEEQYQYLYHAPKLERAITIGKLQGRDSNVTTLLKNGIENARRIFIESNNIQNYEILAIRNDAITIIGRPAVNLDITDRVKFRLAGNYRSFYHLGTVDLFYNYDQIYKNEVLDVKGLGDLGVALHRNYILDFFAELFYSAQIEGVKAALSLLETVYSNYIKKELDIGYYREFNPRCGYKLNSDFSMCSAVYMNDATNRDKMYIDIGFNEVILRQLNRMLTSVYFKTS